MYVNTFPELGTGILLSRDPFLIFISNGKIFSNLHCNLKLYVIDSKGMFLKYTRNNIEEIPLFGNIKI